VPWPAGKLETFYYFAPHPDPSRPLVAWMNGGPGASSVVGLFAELGPLLLNARSAPRPGRDGWELFANPDGWGAEGSLLAWEQPAGVGFSRCPGCGDWNDTSATMASHAFLLAFYEAFPAERSRPLFIAGESYGGIYVPLLANQVHLHNSKAAEAIPLRGVAIGNGCIGFGVSGACGTDSLELLVEVLETAAPGVDRSLLAQVRHACRGELDKGLGPADLSTACRSAFKELEEEIGDYNSYHFGSPCGPDEQGNWGDGSAFSCGSMAATRSYFNDLEVQRALHAVPASATEALKWTTWDGDAPFYNITVADAQPVYRALLAANYSMLIYNGLRDTCVPAIGVEKWAPRVSGEPLRRRKWGGPDGGLAGHVTEFADGLTFATIEGAGHFVPADRPRQARAMLGAFVRGEALPEYTGRACTPLWLGRSAQSLCGAGAAEALGAETPAGLEALV